MARLELGSLVKAEAVLGPRFPAPFANYLLIGANGTGVIRLFLWATK